MFRERPLLIPFLALAAGLSLADLYGLRPPLSLPIALFVCLVLSCFIRHRLPVALCTCAFFLVWGMYALTPWSAPPASPDNIAAFATRDPVVVEGVILSRPVSGGAGAGFIMRADMVIRDGRTFPASGKLMVRVAGGAIGAARGDRVRLATRIAVPHLLGLPGEFDYPRYLAFQGVAATGWVATALDIVLIRGKAEDSPARRLDLAARTLEDFIRATLPDVAVSSVLSALLIGDQKMIPPGLADAYKRAGVSHILSISGFHVGIIAFFIVQAALLLVTRSETLALRFNLRRVVLLISLPAMLLYLFLTGAAPATARSVIMLSLFVVALYVERELDPVNALLMSALLLVAVNPPTLFDISFQLSFLALWGIVILVPPAMRCFAGSGRGWPRTLLQFTVTSCAASCATAVPVLFAFNQATFSGIISNFLIVPLLGYGAVLAGFCALPFVYLYAPLARLLLWPAGILTDVSNRLVVLLSDLPVLRFHGLTRLDMFLFLACMLLLTLARGKRLKSGLCVLLPVMAVMAHLWAPAAADGRLHVTMLSVGQAEATLFRLPDGSVMLVDGGGYLHDNGRDFGERILAPALFKLGVRRIDRLVMTHSHPDHIGGLPHIAGIMPVGEFWEPAPGGTGKFYGDLRAALARQGVAPRLLAAGDVMRLGGGVTVSVLSPRGTATRRDGEGDDMEMNEESLVFRLVHGDVGMLFTADAGFPAEARMLADGAPLASRVLKVGHHGSRFATSDAFLDRVAPEIALISAGGGNAFGLPSRRTTELLRRRGIRTYRTDLDGSIELVSDGASVHVATPFRSD